MSDSLKNFLIELVIGFVAAIAICLMVDVTGAETTADLLRLLSDGFFAAAAIFLAVGGITFTTNGGVFDGLGFTFKSVIGRFKRDYEENRDMERIVNSLAPFLKESFVDKMVRNSIKKKKD